MKRKSGDRSRKPAYRSWEAMIRRCTNPRSTSYKNHGARGIKVCDRWLKSYDEFHADMGDRPHGTTLDRIDNHGNYEPGNCRWADSTTQQSNRRNNRWFELNGRRRTLAQLSAEFNIPRRTFTERVDRGWPLEQALTVGPFGRPRGERTTP